MSVVDDINAGVYESKMPFPPNPKRPLVLALKLSKEEIATLGQTKDSYAEALASASAAQDAYNVDQKALTAKFRADLEAEYGMTGHPKADKLYAMAWERGHSSGLKDVVSEYDELVDLVR